MEISGRQTSQLFPLLLGEVNRENGNIFEEEGIFDNRPSRGRFSLEGQGKRGRFVARLRSRRSLPDSGVPGFQEFHR